MQRKLDKILLEDVKYLVSKHDTIIDVNNLDNTYEMILKRLELQYADAMAHTPSKIGKRVRFLKEKYNEIEER